MTKLTRKDFALIRVSPTSEKTQVVIKTVAQNESYASYALLYEAATEAEAERWIRVIYGTRIK